MELDKFDRFDSIKRLVEFVESLPDPVDTFDLDARPL